MEVIQEGELLLGVDLPNEQENIRISTVERHYGYGYGYGYGI